LADWQDDRPGGSGRISLRSANLILSTARSLRRGIKVSDLQQPFLMMPQMAQHSAAKAVASKQQAETVKQS
jgi:hypothetical protein